MLPRLLALALLAALALAGWQWRAATSARAETAAVALAFADYREAQERNTRLALEQQRAEKDRADKLRQEALDAEYLARLAAQADADRVRGTAGQLQRYAADLAAALGAAQRDPAAASSGAAAEERIALVVGSLDDFAADAATAADRARIAGQLCERSYDALTARP